MLAVENQELPQASIKITGPVWNEKYMHVLQQLIQHFVQTLSNQKYI